MRKFYAFTEDIQIVEIEAEGIEEAFMKYILNPEPEAVKLLALCYRKDDAETLQKQYLKEIKWQ